MRRKPAACSKVLGPRPVTSSNCLRLLNAPLASRQRTMLAATVVDRPETRDSSGADAVFRSTPTAFTQSSTTRTQGARHLALIDVMLVLADADALRVDLHQLGQRVLQAAGDRHRAAQAHVQIGQLVGRELGGRVDRRPRLADHDFLDHRVRARVCWMRLIRSAASLSVSRLAVPLPMAIRLTPWVAHRRPACAASLPSPCAARAGRRSRCPAPGRCR